MEIHTVTGRLQCSSRLWPSCMAGCYWTIWCWEIKRPYASYTLRRTWIDHHLLIISKLSFCITPASDFLALCIIQRYMCTTYLSIPLITPNGTIKISLMKTLKGLDIFSMKKWMLSAAASGISRQPRNIFAWEISEKFQAQHRKLQDTWRETMAVELQQYANGHNIKSSLMDWKPSADLHSFK